MPYKNRPSKGVCAIEECERPQMARGWCQPHWKRWRKYGDPRTLYMPRSLWERIERWTDRSGGCWVWTHWLDQDGYAHASYEGKRVRVHRWSWEQVNGPVPPGLELDHLCRTRGCVRPDHLQAVSHRENMMRGVAPSAVNAKKTQCKHGHPFSGENLILQIDGRRSCRTCTNRRARTRYWNQKLQTV